VVLRDQADEFGQLEMQLPAESKLNIFVGEQFHQVERLPITTPMVGISKDLTVNLEAAASIHGQAVDGLGEGVADAVVLLQRGKSSKKFQTRSYAHRTLTDENGSYELPSVPAGDYLLQVGHQGYERLISTPFSIADEDCGRQINKQVELSRGLSISGKFDNSDGEPIAGATIWVMDPSELPSGSADPVPPMGIPHSGESSEDGTFLVHGWSQARGSGLMIVAPGYLTEVISNSEIQDPLQITLQRGLSLSIKVEQDQKMVPAASVKLVHRLTATRTRGYTEVTQANGRATFVGLAPGLYHATVSDERGFGATLPFELTASGQVEVLDLGHGAGFELTAIDEHGKPLPNLPLNMLRLSDLPNSTVAATAGVTDQSSVSGKTDINGRFSMHVRPGVWMLSARPKDRTPLSQKIELYSNDVAQVEHQFGLVGSLAVTAVGPDGKPLRNLQVALAPESGHQKTNRVDVAGNCYFRDLEPGTYMVYPWNPRQQPSEVPEGARPVIIHPGEQTEIELDNSFVATPTIRVLRDGSPVKSAEVRLTPLFATAAPTFDSRHSAKQHTDDAGQWVASPIRAGRYLVAVRGGINQPEQRWKLDLPSGVSDHKLNLEEFQVSGRLTLPNGDAISGVRIELERQVLAADGTIQDAPIGSDEELHVQAVSGENGVFHFARIPSGSWQIRVCGQKWTGPSKPLFQVNDADADLGNLHVEESCTVRLKLSAQTIKEAEFGAGSAPRLELLHMASGLRYQLYANNQGLAERSDLPSGEYELHFADRPSTPMTLTPEYTTERILN